MQHIKLKYQWGFCVPAPFVQLHPQLQGLGHFYRNYKPSNEPNKSRRAATSGRCLED